MPSRNDRRYEQITRSFAQRRAEEARAPTQNALSAALDGLNAFGFLEDLQAIRDPRRLCYGPKAVTGANWAGVVIWRRPRGYYAYRTLTLLGIWATLDGARIGLRAGEKTLTFNGPYFNVESYNMHIQTRFDLHYDGDASPPPEEGCLYTAPYDPTRRLAIRRAIQTALDEWGQN